MSDEGTIRMQAEMYALVAQMNAINAEIEAMKVANRINELKQQFPTYTESDFNERIGRLVSVLKHLRTDI